MKAAGDRSHSLKNTTTFGGGVSHIQRQTNLGLFFLFLFTALAKTTKEDLFNAASPEPWDMEQVYRTLEALVFAGDRSPSPSPSVELELIDTSITELDSLLEESAEELSEDELTDEYANYPDLVPRPEPAKEQRQARADAAAAAAEAVPCGGGGGGVGEASPAATAEAASLARRRVETFLLLGIFLATVFSLYLFPPPE